MVATIRTKTPQRAVAFSVLAIFLALPATTDVALAQEGVSGWREVVFDSRWNEQAFVELAASRAHTVARRSDGSVVAWGGNSSGQCNVPALPPGVTFARIAAGYVHTVAVLQAGAYTTFGAGCPSSAGVTHLEAMTLPRVGATMAVRVEPLPLSVAVMISGFSNVSWVTAPLPLDLSPLGLTNCWLRVSLDANDALIGALGSATHSLAIPGSAALAGFVLHQQAVVLDPAASNPLGLVMSDAATAVVGL